MRRQSMQRFVQLLCAIGLLTLSGGAVRAAAVEHTLVNASPPLIAPGDLIPQPIEPAFMINMNINPVFSTQVPGWSLTSAGLIFEVTYSPNAGPIHKQLKGSNGGNFLADNDTSNDPALVAEGPGPNTLFVLQETIVVGANSGIFTDWHESILTPDWVWTGSFIVIDPDPFMGGDEIIVDDAGMRMGPDIWFFFDFVNGLAPGTALHIEKGLQYIGETQFDGIVEIIEWPTVPAPAALPAGLMLLGAMGLVRRRRARRVKMGALSAGESARDR